MYQSQQQQMHMDIHLFNSSEQTLGDYRVQIATQPEFPQIGERSQILIRVTDQNGEEVDRFTMGN